MSTMEAAEGKYFSGLIPPDQENLVSVSDFFKGRDVFITGALGFMGKVLVEKLLWECEDIGNLYLLVRPKKKDSVEKRLEDLFELPVFDRIKRRDPAILSKVLPIQGDLTDPGLGISPENQSLLEEKVSIVFHAGSSVRFDDPLKKAILLNVRGTRDVVYLSKKMKNLKAMIYVSTAYSNTSKKEIHETVLTSHVDWKNIIKTAEDIDEHTLNILSAKIVGKHPNTYTFSKQVAESVVYEHRLEIPTIIFRPSIVFYSVTDPMPGWVESLNGPMGIVIGVLVGVIHIIYGNINSVLDFIPCDYAINGLIATAWYRGIVNNNECVAVNAANGKNQYCQTINSIYVKTKKTVWDLPPQNSLWYPWFMSTTNRYLYRILVWIAHLLPAILIDIILSMKGIKFRMVILYRRIFIGNDALHYFLTNEWTILTDNYETLKLFLLPKDKINFHHDTNSFNPETGYAHGLNVVKKYMLKEDVSETGIKKARKRLTMMYWLDRVVRGVIIVLFAWFAFQRIQKYITIPI